MVGLFIVAVVLYDVFQSVVVPRWTDRTLRLSPLILTWLWPLWRRLAMRLRSAEKREDVLGTFAPLALMLILVVWVVALILGYGLVLHALRGQMKPPLANVADALYLSGEGLLTFGFGDFVAVGNTGRVMLIAAGASGLAVVALVISLTFSLYGSFQRREVMVLTLDARAGSPPSGVEMLETYARLGMLGDLPATFASWELWSAEMLDSHLAYPILPYFRSSHTNESWVSALGAVLDAATLLLTTVQEVPAQGGDLRHARLQGPAQMMYALGCHAVIDLSHWFRFRPHTAAVGVADAGVERGEFELARQRLMRAGYVLRDADESWQRFMQRRSEYSGALNDLAKHLSTPPTQWIGDRSTVAYLHRHESQLQPQIGPAQ